MKLLVGGILALDDLKTPHSSGKAIVGGAGIYSSVAASFFTQPGLVGPAGSDFPEAALAVLFFWSGAEVGRPAVTAADAPEPGGSGEPMVTPPLRPPSPQSGSLTGSSTPAQDDATPTQDDATPAQDDRTADGSPGSVGGGE